jgi:hypothetical protein
MSKRYRSSRPWCRSRGTDGCGDDDRAAERPGQQITVTVPPGQTRRLYYVLARHGKPLYYLYSGEVLTGPGWFSALDLDQYDLLQPESTALGPDHLIIPPPAAPGSYELCTHNASGESCARLVVAG